MGERTSYTPGTFSWAELVTSDADAAKSFYSQLFGWEYEDNPTGPDGPVYSMAQRDGHTERLAGEIGDLGGRLYNGPVQVPSGVFAVLVDPQGAIFAVLTGEYDD